MKHIVLGVALFRAACARSTVQTVSQVCGLYSATLVSLSVYKSSMTESQTALVDSAILVLAPTCEGEMPLGEADDFLLSSLDSLELLLLKLRAN